MGSAVVEIPSDEFELDVRIATDPVHPDIEACSTDDGCGQTCEKSACNSAR